MQIRPHFYLNCLKSIFGLVQIGKKEQIQNALLHLSAHLRYVFAMDTDVIPLEKELQMCENYIKLQQECECGKPEISIAMDTAVLEAKVPPISCLTLVENCMKHAMAQNGSLMIWIQAKMLEIDGRRLVEISVRDNGPGFRDEMMKDLNSTSEKESVAGIGLLNIIKRFHLLYGEECAIHFSNKQGACVEILFAL